MAVRGRFEVIIRIRSLNFNSVGQRNLCSSGKVREFQKPMTVATRPN